MIIKRPNPIFVLAILVATAVLASGDVEPELFDMIRVDITNELGSGNSLTIHCRSKDTDLGERVVADGGDYAWNFRVNAWGTTLYYCDLKWEEMSGFGYDSYSASLEIWFQSLTIDLERTTIFGNSCTFGPNFSN